jgi:hypothetical protein
VRLLLLLQLLQNQKRRCQSPCCFPLPPHLPNALQQRQKTALHLHWQNS